MDAVPSTQRAPSTWSSLSMLHWVGIFAAAISAVVHLVLGVGFLPHPMGVAFLVATAGFLVGIGAVLSGRADRRLYLAGIGFTAGQIGLWLLLTEPALGSLTSVELLDKGAQIVLIGVLARLVARDA